jgi:hypothetical protein
MTSTPKTLDRPTRPPHPKDDPHRQRDGRSGLG